MPCNSVVFQKAYISITENDQLTEKAAAVITVEAATKLLNAVLTKLDAKSKVGNFIQRSNASFTYFNNPNFSLTYSKLTGALQVSVSESASLTRAEAQQLAQLIKEESMKMLVSGAGALLQAKIAAVVKAKMTVTETQKVANGAVVLRVKL